MGVIYLRTNKINGKQYVGQTTNMNQRNRQWRCLKWNYANRLLTDERNTYGLENFKLEILKECNDSELDEWEKHFIKELKTTYPNGYNDNEGGSIGFRHSEKTKKKISITNKKSAEKRKDILVNQLKQFQFEKGHKPWNKGKKGCFDEETIKKMSESAKSKPPMEESTKQKMSDSRMGIFLNREDQSKKVYQYTLDGLLVAIYPSRNEAGRAVNTRGTSIGNCCNGGYFSNGKWVNVNTVKGYRWSYEPL